MDADAGRFRSIVTRTDGRHAAGHARAGLQKTAPSHVQHLSGPLPEAPAARQPEADQNATPLPARRPP